MEHLIYVVEALSFELITLPETSKYRAYHKKRSFSTNKMKIITLNIALIISIAECIACKCSHNVSLEDFMWADYVATVEITQGYVENVSLGFNIDGYWIRTKPIEVYKGIAPDSLKVTGFGMCVLALKTKSKWIVYAVKNKEGIMAIGYCSGSKQVDINENYTGHDSDKLLRNYSQPFEKEIHQLEILKKNNINYTHSYFSIRSYELWEKLGAYQGILLESDFAIFEVEFTDSLTIKYVKVIEGFNSKIDEELSELISESSFVENRKMQGQKTNFRWLIGIYYYPEKDGNPSFFSRWLL
jgi:hypothetical protein